MTDYFTYQKKRKEFGRYPQFEDTDTQIVGQVDQVPEEREDFILRDPNTLKFDNICK